VDGAHAPDAPHKHGIRLVHIRVLDRNEHNDSRLQLAALILEAPLM